MEVEAKGWYELNAPFHYTVSFEVSISDKDTGEFLAKGEGY